MADAPRFYTTVVPASKRIADLMGLFGKHADLVDSYHVMNEGGRVAAFAVSIRGVGYRFAPNVEGIRDRMVEAGLSLSAKGTAEPEAVAWAQLYTMIEMQLEAVATGVADVEEVFGGWALTSSGHTVGDMIRERRGELMPGEHPLLTAGPGEG